jgi:KaiC/GvpD/RAD55 family RecA-like ATPase
MTESSQPILSSAVQVLGGEREREVLDQLLERAGVGRGGVLVMHGEPGVGKTVLL